MDRHAKNLTQCPGYSGKSGTLFLKGLSGFCVHIVTVVSHGDVFRFLREDEDSVAIVFALLTIRVEKRESPTSCGDSCRRQRGEQSPDSLRTRNWTDGSCLRLLQGPVPRRPPLLYAAFKDGGLNSLGSTQN
jgi:hypothetical protein